ncbi:MAG: hypothetical protein ACEPOV_08115 [Hyphomicrobiales bacterium]
MNIIKANINVLTELHDLVQILDDNQYAKELEVFSGSTIGMHTRHILEFYLCLFQQYRDGTISYDKRIRDINLAIDTEYTLDAIKRIKTSIENCHIDKDLTLIGSIDGSSDASFVMKTNIGRELFYNLEHSIHHMALIKIGVYVIDSEIKISDSFGVAPSTLRYKKDKNTL